MASSDRIEAQAVIKFCSELGKTPTQTYKMIQTTSVKNTGVSRSLVFEWHRRFCDGRESLKDDVGRGRKRKYGVTLVTSIDDALAKDRGLKVRTLSEMFGVGYGTIHRILTEDLQMSKVTFLRRYKREGDGFLSRIITTDETWLWFYDPETKSQSAVWKRSGSPSLKKARVSKSCGKYMFIMFADMHGMIHSHAVPSHMTINADY
ncbi:protein GVQW3-like [Mya arenaria]|uniref:protein GVQW3-like n=1 Tax=Mya arenaria TaxID=6604 RepID=UPI0022E1B753|nr:protein GVQW3-like [Mya arenaria]